MSYVLRCGRCGGPLARDGVTMQTMTVRVGDLLCHMEPCSLGARYGHYSQSQRAKR